MRNSHELPKWLGMPETQEISGGSLVAFWILDLWPLKDRVVFLHHLQRRIGPRAGNVKHTFRFRLSPPLFLFTVLTQEKLNGKKVMMYCALPRRKCSRENMCGYMHFVLACASNNCLTIAFLFDVLLTPILANHSNLKIAS